MMRHLVVFWVLLFNVRYAGVRAQAAIWKFPAQGEGIQANIVDTVLLDWTSTLPSTILRMWCANTTDGGNFALASSFYVDSTGPFKYVMETYDPNETTFPLSCHAELAADPMGSGFDSPAGIVWSSNSAQAAKTISQTQPATSVTVTVVSTPPPGLTPTAVPPSPKTSVPPTSTNANPSQASTNANPSQSSTTASNNTLSTKSLESPSGATAASQLSASTSASSSPNNTGAIIGGAIGGVALLSFISLAVLFLRKYQRDRTSSSPMTPEPSKNGLYLFNVYKNRGARARTTGIFEKEGDNGAYDEEGSRWSQGGKLQEKGGLRASRWGRAHEMQGSTTWKKTVEGASWVGGRYHPVELPGDSSNFPSQDFAMERELGK